MKLLIFGASGAGVIASGKVLSTVLNAPYFDSNTFYWEHSAPPPFTVRRPAEVRDAGLAHALLQAAD